MATGTERGIEGKIGKAKGIVKEEAGKVLEDRSLETEGKVEQIRGEAKEAIGKVRRGEKED